MWQFLLGLVVGFALGWLLNWYLSRDASRALREEVAKKEATIARLLKDAAVAPQAAAKAVERPEPKPAVAAAEPVEVVTAYCVKCRDTHAMDNPRRVMLANGRPAIKGTCPTCKSGMVRLIKA